MFLAIRGPDNHAITALLDETNGETQVGIYAANENITLADKLLSNFSFVGAIPILSDQISRIALGREEDVGEERHEEPLLLTPTYDNDEFAKAMKNASFDAGRLEFGLSLSWQQLLAFWMLLDGPGLLRESRLTGRKKIEKRGYYCT